MLTCKDFLAELSDFLDETVNYDIREKLETHLKACPNCWVICDTTKKTIQVYKANEQRWCSPPPNIHARLMEALEKKVAEKKAAMPQETTRKIQKVNLAEQFGRFQEHFEPRIAGELNGQQVKLVKFQGPFIWHHHDSEDELFLVVKGEFTMEFREAGDAAVQQVPLRAGEFLIVPKGIEHRPVAENEVEVLLFEPASTLNTGNIRNERTIDELKTI